MANVVTQLRDWLLQNRPFRMGRLEKDAAYPSQVKESLANLPEDIANQLIQLVKQLPNHPRDQQTVQEAVATAVRQWQEDPELVNNSLVFLSSPVSAITRILSDGLADWAEQSALRINLFDWIERPIRAEQIQSTMQETLVQTESESNQKNVAVIPNLSWCFLRSAEGLDGIDYLRDCLLSDRTQFWIIGGGQVGWQYLNSILKLQAHCGDVVKLPNLSGEELQDWLMPIIDQLQICFDQTSIQERLQELGEEQSHFFFFKNVAAFWEEIGATAKSVFRNAIQNPRSLELTAPDDEDLQWIDYFERLSDLSEGVSTIALQLFVKSIGYEEIEDIAEQKRLDEVSPKAMDGLLESESKPPHRLVARLPKLPKLPDLEQNDLYILYSLLVHGDLTLNALAESLGEERQIVNDQVQVLRQDSLIEQQGQVVKVNPIHYPRLKKDLASNNFIIEIAE